MTMKSRVESDSVVAMADPFSGSSLVPMLLSGLVLIVVGMIAVAAFS